MRAFKFIILFLIGIAIFGSAGFFGYELFVKPARLEKQELAASAVPTPIPTPTPDPGAPEFQKLKALQDSGKTAEAQEGLSAWVLKHAKSPLLPEARQRLGNANFALLFQPGTTNVVSYTVVKGDSLARIASKHQSNPELIQRANYLPGINLQIGQELVIPTLKISLDLDRSNKTLTVVNNGTYLKEYPLLSIPPSSRHDAFNTNVVDKIALSGNKRVAFGDKAYLQSERNILVSQSAAIIGYAAQPSESAPTSPAATNLPTPPPLPGGYVLSTTDLMELFPLVSRNTPVIIH
jgi:LysM repeat protein